MVPNDATETGGDGHGGSPASHGVKDRHDNHKNDDGFAAFRAYQQLDEQSQLLKIEATEISRRLHGIRQQLVTFSDKMMVDVDTSTTTMTGAQVSKQDMKMAREAQAIMRRMGEIKGRLHAISNKKKQYHAVLSTTTTSSSSSFFHIADAASVGSSSLGLPSSLDGFSEIFSFNSNQNKNDPSQGSTMRQEYTRSVLPGAISLGSTPCMASSSSKTDYPGGFLAASLYDNPSNRLKATPKQQQQQFLEMEDQRDGVPSPVRIEGSNQRKSSFPDNPPKVLPWGMGIPGTTDHGIGVIGKKRTSRLPSLEPIASFEISTDISEGDLPNLSMNSQLSPIPTDEESSVNAFDYPLVKPEAMNAVTAGSTSVSNHTAALFDDALTDTSSIEDTVEALEGRSSTKSNVGNHRGNVKTANQAKSEQNCVQETVMDVLFCRAMDSAAPFLANNGNQPTTRRTSSGGVCGQVLCHPEEGQEYSLETFLGPCQAKEAWI